MKTKKKSPRYDDLDLGDEQMTSNECWDPDENEKVTERVFKDLDLGEERVTSNECYDVEDK